MRNVFTETLKAKSPTFGLRLSAEKLDRLSDFYEIVQENNELLHLVAPCSPEEFAVRHVLESLLLLDHLPQRVRFADVGAGAGLPSIPCLLVRDDLNAAIIESKRRKADYLEAAVNELGLTDRATVFPNQFEEVRQKDFSVVVCRALDKFIERLPRLLKWSAKKQRLFFGGPGLREALERQRVSFDERLIPLSQQRYIFHVR